MADFSLLPEDVLINILLRLPIKYVFRSRSVCKNWNSLLQSPNSSLYYNHQLCRQERLAKDGVCSFIVLEYVENASFARWFRYVDIKDDLFQPYENDYSDSGWYNTCLRDYRDYFDGEYPTFDPSYVLLSFVTLKKMKDELITTVDRVEKLDILFTSIEDRAAARYTRLANVYDGIICLQDEIGVTLYNPYTRESQRIPFNPCEHPSYYHVVLGLWFESTQPATIKHYKIFSLLVLLNYVDFSLNATHVFVFEKYDSIESSWTEIKTLPNRSHPFKRYNCLLLNEILHLYDDPCSDSLITLDVRSETLGLLPLPSGIAERNIGRFRECRSGVYGESHFLGSCFAPHIFVLGRSLAMFVENNDSDSCKDIWIMIEYGVKESWTKQYTICDEHITPSDFYSEPLNDYHNYYGFLLWWKLLLNWKCIDEDMMFLEIRNMHNVLSELDGTVTDPRRKLVSFNLFSNKLTEINMYVTGELLSVIPYIETIISLK